MTLRIVAAFLAGLAAAGLVGGAFWLGRSSNSADEVELVPTPLPSAAIPTRVVAQRNAVEVLDAIRSQKTGWCEDGENYFAAVEGPTFNNGIWIATCNGVGIIEGEDPLHAIECAVVRDSTLEILASSAVVAPAGTPIRTPSECE